LEIKNYIKIYDDILPHKILSNFLKYCNYVNFEKAKILGKDGNNYVDDNQRKVEAKCLNNFKSDMTETHWSNYLYSVFIGAIERYQCDINLFGTNVIKNIVNIDLLKYENTGFYNYHFDHHANEPRTISIILMLNNDYEGGNLCFKDNITNNETVIDTKPNRLIIWPSNFLFPHKVNPVTKGTRYSVVCWAV